MLYNFKMALTERDGGRSFNDIFDQVAEDAYNRLFDGANLEDLKAVPASEMIPDTYQPTKELINLYLPDVATIAHAYSMVKKVIGIVVVSALAEKVGMDPFLTSVTSTFVVAGYPFIKSLAIRYFQKPNER